MEYFYKQPSEKFGKGIDFTGQLPSGATISGGTATAIDVETGASAASVLTSGTMTISGATATALVQAGTHGKDYKITCVVTLSDSSILEEDLYMMVRAG